MDIEKIINDLIEEYQVFYSGTLSEFLAYKGIHSDSKIGILIKDATSKNNLYMYQLINTKAYIKKHTNITFKDLCSRDSLWYW